MSGGDDEGGEPTNVGAPGKVRSERIYTGRIINLDRDTVRFPDGSIGELEMVRQKAPIEVATTIIPSTMAYPSPLLITRLISINRCLTIAYVMMIG